MDKAPLAEYIRSVLPISNDIVMQIIEPFEERVYKRGDFLLSEGRVSDEYLFLSEGFMRAYTHDTEGREVTTNFYLPGRVIFEVSSFFLRTRSTENVQAVEDSKGYQISFAQLNTLFHAIPEFREFGRAMLVKEFVVFKQRTLGLIHLTAEERYAQLMETHSDILRHAQLKHIASYLGITDSSLSRIRKDFAGK